MPLVMPSYLGCANTFIGLLLPIGLMGQAIISISPTSAPANNPPFTLTVTGDFGGNPPSLGTHSTIILSGGGSSRDFRGRGTNNGDGTLSLQLDANTLNRFLGQVQVTVDWCEDGCLSSNSVPFIVSGQKQFTISFSAFIVPPIIPPWPEAAGPGFCLQKILGIPLLFHFLRYSGDNRSFSPQIPDGAYRTFQTLSVDQSGAILLGSN